MKYPGYREGLKVFSSFKNSTATPCLCLSILLITAGPVRVRVWFCPVNSGGRKRRISACSSFSRTGQDRLITKAPPWDKFSVTPSTSLDVRASLILILKLFSVLVYFLLSNESMLCSSKVMKLRGKTN